MDLPTPTLGVLLDRQAEAHGDRTFLFWKDDRVSFRDVRDRADRVAGALRQRGLERGDRLALWLPNRPEFLWAWFGAAKAGVAVVPVNPALTVEEAAYVIGDAGARLLIAPGDRAPDAAAVQVACPALADVVDADAGFGALLDSPPGSDPDVGPDDLAAIVYTSGTTGRPKGAMLTHRNYLFDAEGFARAAKITAEDRFLCVLPLFHVNAQVASTLGPMLRGGALVLMPGFSPSTFLPALERYRATSFSGVPTVYSILNQLPDAERYDLSALRVCICGAAPMPVATFETFERTYNAFILEGYGLSEGTCVSTLNPLDGRPRKVGTIGVALPGQRVRVVDERGEGVAPGTVGEIVTRGDHVMRGYWNDPEATAEAVRDGWLWTGDLGRMDADGYFTIVGRRKEMIIRGGENVYPKEIEEVLHRHPAVAEAAVVGLPDRQWGETVAAFVVLRDGAGPDAGALVDFARQRLAAFKVPSEVRFVEALPKTATGKVRKRALVDP